MTIETLRRQYPFPLEKPKDLLPIDFGWISGAHNDVFSHYMKNTKIILEIGSFCGKSAKLALDSSPPDSTLICVDPWYFQLQETFFQDLDIPIPAKLPDVWELFRVNMWNYKERIIPIKLVSQMALFRIKEHNVEPDIVYIDGNHTFDGVITDLELVHQLFPKAQIFGDDWNYKNKMADVKEAVEYWAFHHQFKIQVHKNRVYRIVK
jgi:hypothetical protein